MKKTPVGMAIRDRLHFHSMPVAESGCWIWLYGTARYPEIKINGKMLKVHRASWEEYRGKIPADMNVLHKCDITHCINPDHLFLGTQFDNIRDMHRKGRDRKRGQPGEANGMAKLTSDDVRAIRLTAGIEAEDAVAKRYGVSRGTVGAIRRGEIWAWLK